MGKCISLSIIHIHIYIYIIYDYQITNCDRIQNKRFCLHNIYVCTVYSYYVYIYIYIYIYINTHTCMYIFMKKCVYILNKYFIWYKLYECKYISGGPLSALTCCVNARLLSAIKKISPLIYSQSWVGSWVYTTQAMMTFTLIF